MDAIPRIKIPKFEKWLAQMGAEILPPTSEFEMLRFRCTLGIGVIYQGKRGISTSGQIVLEAFKCYSSGKAWRGKGKPTPKNCMTKRQNQLLARDGDACFFCGEPMAPGDISVEHLLARLHGGPNRMENLVLAHPACNLQANHLSIMEKIKLRDERRAKGS